MKQYGVSKQEAYDELNKQVVKAWKDINQECLKPTPVLMPIITRVLNIARMMNILYKDGDEFTHVGKQRKDLIASILIDPVPISPLMAMKKEAFSYNALAFTKVQRSSQNSWLREIKQAASLSSCVMDLGINGSSTKTELKL
ncbi:Alpha-humulene synthase [Vitis vinifera]|uniref:Alpha-humulene synthase n=1 Tax=Vitis vinifera TaxID=29760 RepID=A0A438E5V8_VITVI|nr:Alpha-humulene synthase [Vitis vinifera]